MTTAVAILYLVAVILLAVAAFGVPARVSLAAAGRGVRALGLRAPGDRGGLPLMAKVTRAASRSVYVASSPSDRMSVWHLRDFLAALDEAGIPENVKVEYSRSDAGHLTGLSVRHSVNLDPDAAEALGETVFDATTEAPPTP